MAGRDQRNPAICYVSRIGEITIQGRVLYKISIDMFILVLNTALFELRKNHKAANSAKEWVSLIAPLCLQEKLISNPFHKELFYTCIDLKASQKTITLFLSS